jgi:hypothetical protein
VTSKNSDANTIGFIPPAPPFDYRVERKYETLGLGASKLMTEIEERYDKQAITRLVPVIDGTTDERISQTLPSGTRFVLLPQSYTDEWVLVTTTKTVHEIFEDDTCVARMTSSHSDKGGAFLLKHGYAIPADIEDISIGESEKAYTALDTLSDRTNIEFLPGSSSLAGDRQTLEQEGRQKVYITTEGNTNIFNISRNSVPMFKKKCAPLIRVATSHTCYACIIFKNFMHSFSSCYQNPLICI